MALSVNVDGNFVLQSSILQRFFDEEIESVTLTMKVNCCTPADKEVVVADLTGEDTIVITPAYVSVDSFVNTFYTFKLTGVKADGTKVIGGYCKIYASDDVCDDIAAAVADYTARHLGNTDLHCRYMLLEKATGCTCTYPDGRTTCDDLCKLWSSIIKTLNDDYKPDTMSPFPTPCGG